MRYWHIGRRRKANATVAMTAVQEAKSICMESKKKNMTRREMDAPSGRHMAWRESRVWMPLAPEEEEVSLSSLSFSGAEREIHMYCAKVLLIYSMLFSYFLSNSVTCYSKCFFYGSLLEVIETSVTVFLEMEEDFIFYLPHLNYQSCHDSRLSRHEDIKGTFQDLLRIHKSAITLSIYVCIVNLSV